MGGVMDEWVIVVWMFLDGVSVDGGRGIVLGVD